MYTEQATINVKRNKLRLIAYPMVCVLNFSYLTSVQQLLPISQIFFCFELYCAILWFSYQAKVTSMYCTQLTSHALQSIVI